MSTDRRKGFVGREAVEQRRLVLLKHAYGVKLSIEFLELVLTDCEADTINRMAFTMQCTQFDAVACLEPVEPPVRQTEFGIRDVKSVSNGASLFDQEIVREDGLAVIIFVQRKKSRLEHRKPNTATIFTALRATDCIFWRMDDAMHRRARLIDLELDSNHS